MISAAQLDRALNPRTVAVVGDVGARGYRWLKCMSPAAKVYSVQVDPKEIPGIEALGFTNYKSLTEIPDEVDYVLMAVPRTVAHIVLRDAIAKQVGGVAMFTSGFAETNTPEGFALQDRVTQMARDANLVLIGPNCMGLYNPALGVRFGENQAVGFEGDVVFLSQSGGLAGDFVSGAHAAGVPVRKVLSFGNGTVLHHPDYLEYFAAEEGTKFIAMYVEGMRDGERFLRVLRETTLRKPVVLWKGGLTDAGRRAAASHTASLAGAADIWDAVARQTGAIQATSVAELVDLLKALRLLAPFTGDGMGLTGGSGGQSVAMADTFSRAGLRVPALTKGSYDRLSSWFSVVGASYGNPIDLGSNRAEIDTVMDVLAKDANVDCIAMQFRVAQGGGGFEAQVASLARCKEQTDKPIAAILHSPTPFEDGPAMAALDARLREIGVPSFAGYERAASAIAKVRAYYRFRAGRRS